MTSKDGAVRIERVEGTVMPVNSYVIEGPDGLVIVDGQLTVTDARAVRTFIDRVDRPVAGLLVTHGHPDHYAGAATLLEGLSAPIVSTAGVAAVIERDDAEKDGIVGAMMGDEWPADRRFPDEVVSPGESIRLGGLTFDARAIGSAESHEDVLYSLGDDLIFSGDIAYNEMHAYLVDGHHRAWIATLEQLQFELPGKAKLYVGHGEPTDTSVLARQADYVRTFVNAVDEHRHATLAERHDAVVDVMRTLVSDDRLLFLMELSIEPVLATLHETV